MQKPKPTVFQITIPSNDGSFKFSPLTLREMESFTQREELIKADPLAKLKLYRELVAKCMIKAGDIESADELEDLDSPTVNTLFEQIMKAHGMNLKAETLPGESKA